MKHALRFIVVAMIFGTTGLFARAAADDFAAPQLHKLTKVVKKSAKKHRHHKKQKAQ